MLRSAVVRLVAGSETRRVSTPSLIVKRLPVPLHRWEQASLQSIAVAGIVRTWCSDGSRKLTAKLVLRLFGEKLGRFGLGEPRQGHSDSRYSGSLAKLGLRDSFFMWCVSSFPSYHLALLANPIVSAGNAWFKSVESSPSVRIRENASAALCLTSDKTIASIWVQINAVVNARVYLTH